nr:MAG TPA: hypothetical protein [Caudoviricetes sp.]
MRHLLMKFKMLFVVWRMMLLNGRIEEKNNRGENLPYYSL